MMRKMLSIVLMFGLIVVMFGLIGTQASEPKAGECTVLGKVYHSLDGAAEIYDETGNWSCDNITAYRLVNVTDTAIDDGTNDAGSHLKDYDQFSFNAASEWSSWNKDEEAICVGETYEASTGKNYVFITQFTISVSLNISINSCGDTEWEPIPTPIVHREGDGWINISIPKFTNLTNSKSVVGFAVYRNGLFINNTMSSDDTHYFYNDINVLSDVVYHYSVAPIAKGNYTTYGESLLASSEELSVVLNSPKGGENLHGVPPNNVHTIKYTISGGSPPYHVVLSYSTDGGVNYPNTINDETITHNEEGPYRYDWEYEIEGVAEKMRVRVNVADYADVTVSNSSVSNFIIDSVPPIVESTIPSADGSVSIKKSVTIVFREKMNQTATQAAFSISPDPLGWSWLWNPAGDTMVGTHNDFVFGTTYTITITTAAKDLAGNYLAEYSWDFTANMNVTLNSPIGGDIWTGGSTHNITYEITGGVAPYNVIIDYTTDGVTYENITTTPINHDAIGLYPHPWELQILDLTTVNVRITLIDANETKSVDFSGNFEIDSTAPSIITYTGNDTYITTIESIVVVFSEEMDKASVKLAFTLKDSLDNPVNGTFYWDGNVMSFIPNETLISNMNYTAMVNASATDKSDPGNALDKDYSWGFIAIEGRGNFFVNLNVPLLPEKGKTYTITVTVSNTGPEAFNISGFLTVKFYESRNGETWTQIDGTKYIQNIWAGNSSCASTPFTFDDYDSYYFLVEVTSNNPADTFPGGEKTGRASAFINIPQPSEEIGLGPYTLIALMVVIVVIVAALILLSLKKKGELTLKEKKDGKEQCEEEKEEEKKESEEEESEE